MNNKNLYLTIGAVLLIGVGLFFLMKSPTPNNSNPQDSEKMEKEENPVSMDKESSMEEEKPMMAQNTDGSGDSMTQEVKKITMKEIALHKDPTDCWFAIDGKVYDASNFGKKHAGGDAVYAACGMDGTVLFNTRPMGSGTPHSEKARGFLPNFYIGELVQE